MKQQHGDDEEERAVELVAGVGDVSLSRGGAVVEEFVSPQDAAMIARWLKL